MVASRQPTVSVSFFVLALLIHSRPCVVAQRAVPQTGRHGGAVAAERVEERVEMAGFDSLTKVYSSAEGRWQRRDSGVEMISAFLLTQKE
jgi:hypothetical protein